MSTPVPDDAWFKKRAKDLYHVEGEVEIDDSAIVSRTDDVLAAGGAYVEAWVWVPLPNPAERTVCPECGSNDLYVDKSDRGYRICNACGASFSANTFNRDEVAQMMLARGFTHAMTAAGPVPIEEWRPYGYDDWRGMITGASGEPSAWPFDEVTDAPPDDDRANLHQRALGVGCFVTIEEDKP
jgi:hypothetical protein